MPSRRQFRLFSPVTVLIALACLVSLWLALRLFGGAFGRAEAAVMAPLYAVGSRIARMAAGNSQGVTQEAYDALLAENAKLRALQDEIVSLKEAIAYRDGNTDGMVVARVLADESVESSRTLIIDKGRGDGIEAGQPVIAGDGIIIGKIARSGAATSLVVLLADARSRLAVSLQGADTTIGLLEGDRGLSMGVSLIPPQAVIAPGDTVVTSGLEPGIRRGLIVGAVEKVGKNAGEPFQMAHIAAPVSARYPLFVQVLVVQSPDSEPRRP